MEINLVQHVQDGITGINKFKKIKKHISMSKKVKVLDIGGTVLSADIIKSILPKSKITIANNNKNDLNNSKDYKTILIDCYEIDKLNTKFDYVFANDLIEHLFDPDLFIEKVEKICKGTLIITTPNIAVWYNRISLLFGKDLPNYSSSRVRTGTFLSEVGAPGHKSVFSIKSLSRLVERHGFNVTKIDSFSYQASNQKDGRGGTIRKNINNLLPKSFQEGIIIYASKKQA